MHKLAKCYRQTILSIVHKRAKPYQLALHKTAKRDKHTKEQKRKRVKPYQTGQVLQANNAINTAQKGQALGTGFAQTGQVLQAINTSIVHKRAKPYQLALHKLAKCYRQTILSIVHKWAKPYQLALHKTAKLDKHTKEQKRKRVKPYQLALHKLAKCYRQTILSIVHKRAKPYHNWLCTKRPSVISTQKSRKGKGSSLTNWLCTNWPSVTGKQYYQ